MKRHIHLDGEGQQVTRREKKCIRQNGEKPVLDTARSENGHEPHGKSTHLFAAVTTELCSGKPADTFGDQLTSRLGEDPKSGKEKQSNHTDHEERRRRAGELKIERTQQTDDEQKIQVEKAIREDAREYGSQRDAEISFDIQGTRELADTPGSYGAQKETNEITLDGENERIRQALMAQNSVPARRFDNSRQEKKHQSDEHVAKMAGGDYPHDLGEVRMPQNDPENEQSDELDDGVYSHGVHPKRFRCFERNTL